MRKLASSAEGRAILLLVALLVVGAWREPRLLHPVSISSILLWISLLAVMAVGQMLVIVSRGIDVSIGSTLGLTGMLVGMAFRDWHLEPWIGIGLGVFIGAGLGLVNGLLIAKARIPPIIATLGTLTAYRGLVFIVSGGRQVDSHQIPSGLKSIAISGPFEIGGVVVSWLLVGAVAVALLVHLFAARTRTGRAIYAIGSSERAAHLHGVPVVRTLTLVYVVCGALAGLAGVMYASRYGFVNPTSGLDLELTVIAAVVIGGCDVRGGVGTVSGAVLGCVLLGTINVALAVLGIDADWQLLVYGSVILAALGLNASFVTFSRRSAA